MYSLRDYGKLILCESYLFSKMIILIEEKKRLLIHSSQALLYVIDYPVSFAICLQLHKNYEHKMFAQDCLIASDALSSPHMQADAEPALYTCFSVLQGKTCIKKVDQYIVICSRYTARYHYSWNWKHNKNASS